MTKLFPVYARRCPRCRQEFIPSRRTVRGRRRERCTECREATAGLRVRRGHLRDGLEDLVEGR
jgi:hypothetical protein